MQRKLNVVLAGLGFGGAFLPIYKSHPDVASVGIFDPNPKVSDAFQSRYGIQKAYGSFSEVLCDRSVDAVHLVSPIPCHEEQAVQVLRSGKHCGCTVPMAMSKQGAEEIVLAAREMDRNYMLMETSVYTAHFFHAKEMLDSGKMGAIQFLRGAHYQDMERWPGYWMGLPPMYYGTHALAPLVMLARSPLKSVFCVGSGTMREELTKQYNNPYPIECAIFEFENGIKAEVTRSLFETARDYTESFTVYGQKQTFEWQQIESENNPVVFSLEEGHATGRGTPVSYQRITPGNYDFLLPEEIRKYTVRNKYYDETNPQVTFEEGGGHGGSHPHLVHEFIMSILESRKPWMDVSIAANITMGCICAHESAMRGGEKILL